MVKAREFFMVKADESRRRRQRKQNASHEPKSFDDDVLGGLPPFTQLCAVVKITSNDDGEKGEESEMLRIISCRELNIAY